jgi:DNA-binding NarL/FixJ family response regulator
MFVDQDEVKMTPKEIPMGILRYGKLPDQIRSINLTKREREILTLWNKGYEREDICKLSGITRESFRVHLHNILQKLSIS